MNLVAAVEAVLFAADEPVPASRIASSLGVSEQQVENALALLAHEYEGRGISLEKVAGGYQILTRPEYENVIRSVLGKKTPSGLSRGALETLAIIAFKQPVTRQDIEVVRGVNAEASIETLLEKGLIKEVGRKKTLGRPKLFGTTEEFLKKAGLNSLDELFAEKPPKDPSLFE